MPFTLTPWRNRSISERQGNGDSFSSLQREMNRMFERFNSDFGIAPFEASAFNGWSPQVNVSETDKELAVTAELPGVEEKDVEVTIDKGALTIKGEKKCEKEEKDKNYYRSERCFGSFMRSIELPKDVLSDKAEANFKNGVLTVKLPKSPEAQKQSKRIPVKAS